MLQVSYRHFMSDSCVFPKAWKALETGLHIVKVTKENTLGITYDKLGQPSIYKVSDNSHALGLPGVDGLLDVASHVLLEHCLDISPLLLVFGEDGLTTEKPALLGTVPMELDSIWGLAFDDILGG